MQKIIAAFCLAVLVIAGFSLYPAWGTEAIPPPSISVAAEGKVMATPDMATLTLEVETQAATAAAASQENARQADRMLKALKPTLGPPDQLRTLGYRLTPVYSYEDKSAPPAVKAYRAVNQFEVKIKEVARLGEVIDTSLKHGATRVNGPVWGHSHSEELQRQAAVAALERARRLAEALAQAAGLKIKSVAKISTGAHFIAPQASGANYLAAKAATPTPIEVGEEEIRAQVQVVFLLSP
jgi:uncharacterized protein YggE